MNQVVIWVIVGLIFLLGVVGFLIFVSYKDHSSSSSSASSSSASSKKKASPPSPGQITYSSPGDHVWTCPDGLTSVDVKVVGGGGGGGSGWSTGECGGGGSAATYVHLKSMPVIPGTSYVASVGKGGSAGENGQSSGFYVKDKTTFVPPTSRSYLDSDGFTVFNFNAITLDYGFFNRGVDNPTTFSVCAWFKSTSSSGILEFSSIIPPSGSYDRILCLSKNGKVKAGVNGGTSTSVVSTADANYLDGKWHFAVFTANGSSIYLYVDGALKDSTSGVGGNYSGHWILGVTNPWNFLDVSNDYYTGLLKGVAISNDVCLTAHQVSELYGASDFVKFQSVLNGISSDWFQMDNPKVLAPGGSGGGNAGTESPGSRAVPSLPGIPSAASVEGSAGNGNSTGGSSLYENYGAGANGSCSSSPPSKAADGVVIISWN
ncbi:hypothetical protein GpartN1_g1943.t1 [Galdieria partita]|uniref:Laminin G domain-containing protein n=1 Tax=Galdieria partita TaxID=83374 RepID=A0A9C7PV30_9RHOD|nr:hypothetical protein GpartN1_g1943.t1 [Galdieria partita]